jgi:hypothetical protein
MQGRRSGPSLFLWVLLAAGCSHVSSATHDGRKCQTAEGTGAHSRCGDSVTSRIPILIADGRLIEAEEIIVQAVAAGMLAHETARQLREQKTTPGAAEPGAPPPSASHPLRGPGERGALAPHVLC